MAPIFVTDAINAEQSNPTRHWVFTLNNYNAGEEDGSWLQEAEYWIIGKEIGTEGTPHLQGYVVFMDRYRLKQITDSNPVAKRCHWEPQSKFSTPRQAADYCKKEGDFLEHGEWYLFVHDIEDPDYDMHSTSSSISCSSSYDEDELDGDEQFEVAPLPRTASMKIPRNA